MRGIDVNENNVVGMERVSRRVQEAVEIFERETVKIIRLEDAPRLAAAPKLIIEEALSATKVFIAKARSEAGGLNTVLREITGELRRAS